MKWNTIGTIYATAGLALIGLMFLSTTEISILKLGLGGIGAIAYAVYSSLNKE